MVRSSPPSSDGVDRRSFLAAGLAGATAATSGCIDRVQSAAGQDVASQLSLTISTLPADSDRACIQIARHLEANLEAVGVDVSLDVRSPTAFLERVLVDQEFDLYVGPHPASNDPDLLYEALHSTLSHERGWQNPFGFTNMSFDALLEDQRRADGEARAGAVERVLSALAEEKPFDPICVPEEHREARTDRFDGWDRGHLASRAGYLGVEPAEDVSELRALVTDTRPSRILNPLSAPLRGQDVALRLVYDSLATARDGELRPWLAESWSWSRAVDDGTTVWTATLDLREDCRFHDDEPLTASDVAFTYRFLADTSLGGTHVPAPAPRHRGRVSAIDAVEVIDDRRLKISSRAAPEVAERAFEVPILPEHRWRALVEEHTGGDDFDPLGGGAWSPADVANVPPIGSGPYRYVGHSERDHVTLERHDDHFSTRPDVGIDGPSVETIRFDVDPGSATSVQRVRSGAADVTASSLAANVVDEEPDDPDVERLRSTARSFYLVGFNARSAPGSDTNFRRAVTSLLDKSWVAESVLHGHATPVATPFDDEWAPEALAWDGADPVTPFAGSDGELDREAAMAGFQAAGYRHDDEGRLVEVG